VIAHVRGAMVRALLLVSLDGTPYFSSKTIHCPPALPGTSQKVFNSWHHLMDFMIQGLELPPQVDIC
jgi:hypothetical protein